MKRLVLSILTAITLASPAFAGDWLVFREGQTKSTELWRGNNAPVAGVNVPASALVLVFTPTDGDLDVHNYELENGSLVHRPPVVVAPEPDPNAPQLENFKASIFNSPDIPLMAKFELMGRFPLLDQYMQRVDGPALIMQTWGGLKLAGYEWMTQEVINIVEAKATEFHIPLMP